MTNKATNIFERPENASKFHQNSIRYKYATEIQNMRYAAGLTQNELGRKLKVPQSSIARWEHGGTNITIETLEKIAKAFNKELRIEFH